MKDIISSEYAPAGVIYSGPPDRPEPPRVEDRKLDRANVKKKLGCSDADFDQAQSLDGFPTATTRTKWGSFALTPVWSEKQLDRWAAEAREKAETILRLVGK